MKRSDKDRARRQGGEQSESLGDDVASMPDEIEASADPETDAPRDVEPESTDAAADEEDAAAASDRRLAEQHDKYLRLAAEYDNFRKRSARERQEAAARGQSELLRGMLDALDDLSRFAHVDPSGTDTGTVVEGVAMVERKMLKALTGLGLEVVNPVDQSFDPATMEAVATEPALSPEDDHVVSKVFQVGYRFNGQLLRPARVVVKQWNG
jgi:molecular chaperone GrpE